MKNSQECRRAILHFARSAILHLKGFFILSQLVVAVILAVFTGAFGTARAGFGRVCRGLHLVEAHAARAIHHGSGGSVKRKVPSPLSVTLKTTFCHSLWRCSTSVLCKLLP